MKNVYNPKQDKLQITLCESNGFGRFLNVSLIQILIYSGKLIVRTALKCDERNLIKRSWKSYKILQQRL